jgi:hypothetical protein
VDFSVQVRVLFPVLYITITIMNELMDKLKSLGLSDEMVAKVIQTVGDFVQSKVPGVDQQMIEKILAGDTSDLLSIGKDLLASKFKF